MEANNGGTLKYKWLLGLTFGLVCSGNLWSHNHIAPSDYRSGVPLVLPENLEATGVTAEQTIARFKEKYATENKPRIIVFWNRPVSDALDGTSYQSSVDSMDIEAGMVRMREAFLSSLLSADVVLVDRSMATRKSAVAENQKKRFSALEPLNAQTIEMIGLENLADAVLEVRPYSSRKGATQFRVKMIDTTVGSVTKRFNYNAADISNSDKLYITSEGYEYRQQPITAEQVGHGLAMEFLTRYAL